MDCDFSGLFMPLLAVNACIGPDSATALLWLLFTSLFPLLMISKNNLGCSDLGWGHYLLVIFGLSAWIIQALGKTQSGSL